MKNNIKNSGLSIASSTIFMVSFVESIFLIVNNNILSPVSSGAKLMFLFTMMLIIQSFIGSMLGIMGSFEKYTYDKRTLSVFGAVANTVIWMFFVGIIIIALLYSFSK